MVGDFMKIGKKLRALRIQKKMTIKELAALCHFSVSFLSDVEREVKNPSFENLKIIADALEAPYSYFLEDEHTSTYQEAVHGGFLEVFELLREYDSWSIEDQQELLSYLRIKQLLRERES